MNMYIGLLITFGAILVIGAVAEIVDSIKNWDRYHKKRG